MMSTTQPRNSNLLDRSNRQEPAFNTSTTQYGVHAAASNMSDKAKPSVQLHSMHAPSHDPFAYYRAFIDTSISQGSGQDGFAQNLDDGYTHAIPENGDIDIAGQHHTRARAVPYNLAVRLANRSNGAPLATIVEQGSYSTLNSRGSLLSIARFPSLRMVENASPGRTSHKVSRSLDENTLQRIPEKAYQEQTQRARNGVCDRELDKEHGTSYPVDYVTSTTSLGSTTHLHPRPQGPQVRENDHNASNRTVKGFFRGVLHNVRASSRTRSWSSSTHASIVEHRVDRLETDDDSPQSQVQASETSQWRDGRFDTPNYVPIVSSSATATPGSDYHARSRQTSSENAESSARAKLPLINPPTHVVEKQTASGTIPQLLPSVATRSRERSASVRLVPPEPCDAAHDGWSVGAPTSSDESSNSISAGHLLYGVSVPGNNASSLTEHDRTREASRNASFCSTMSTSYSGTVVGVDIDLQHDFSHPVRRSRSPTPVAPVWFTPQMAELERQASISESPPESKQAPETEHPPRSITSSALTSLLPIAAASGIVHPNYNTPKISFFSPSGNLIQPEGSSTPGTTSISDFSGTPTVTTSYYNKNTPATYSAFPATTCLPPPRPSLRPMTTPPTSSAPLPAHLRHHHNYSRPEQSQIDSTIDSTSSIIVPAPEVKGCGGIMGTENLIPHNGMRHSHETKSRLSYRRHRSARSFVDDLRYEARCHRARLITAIITSCTSTGKGRVLRKRQVAGRRAAAATAYSTLPRNPTGEAARKKRMHKRHAKNKRDVGLLGPLAAHMLRICFCQPYDGAGKPTHAVARRHAGSMHDKSKKESPRSHVKELDMDAVLPNARVVSDSEGKTNSVRKRTTDPNSNTVRKEKRTTIGSRKHTRMRSDSAVSVGVAVTTAAVGGMIVARPNQQ
jgi:hypothetical protein